MLEDVINPASRRNAHLSVGIIDIQAPDFTDNGDGTGTFAQCMAGIRNNPYHYGYVRTFLIPETTFEFVDGEQEYIIVDYNNGTPCYKKTTIMPNGSDRSLIYVVWRIGLTLHSANQDSIGLGLPNKANSRVLNTEPYAVSSLIGDQVAFRLYRDPNIDTYPNDAIIITFGIHYQINSLGSRTMTAK